MFLLYACGCFLYHGFMDHMPTKKKSTRATRQTAKIDTRKLEKLIRDSVRSEMATQQTRRRVTDTYSQRLQDTDAKVTEFIQQAIAETTRAHKISVDSLYVGYLAAIFILTAGLALAILSINDPKSFTIAILLVVIGGIWTISLQSRNLSKTNRSLVNNLAKLNIIFAGYIRQIHQVDTVFEELAGSSEGITVQTAEQLLNNLQDAVVEAMTAVSTISSELDE